MNEIKNKKAFDKCREVFCVFCPESTKVKCEWVGGVPKCKAYGWKEVIRQLYEMTLAETELSERHAKEMKELRDKAIESYCATKCTMIDGEERCKAPCNPLKLFTKQLTEITINK